LVEVVDGPFLSPVQAGEVEQLGESWLELGVE
jgi:hypothetical protein